MNRETIKLLEIAMSHKEVVDLVQRASDKIWHSLPDVTSFEHTCYTNIGRELLKGEVKSLNSMAKYYISRAMARHLKRTKYVRPDTFSEIANEINDEEEMTFEPTDVLANVEDEVLTKEMTALLAQDDQRKLVILGSWTIGNDNNTEISRLLAQSVGGKIESHRKFIQRFRNECREKLATAI